MLQNKKIKWIIVIFSSFLILFSFFPVVLGSHNYEAEITESNPEYPYPGDDWAWKMVGAEYAQQISNEGEDVKVAVVDTGIDYSHPDLEDKMWDDIGYDFVDDNDDPMDEHGHGTHVAGIIATVAPEAELMALRVIEERGGDWIDVSRAVRFARRNGADIITMSFGGEYSLFTRAFELQIERAYRWDDMLMVGAAGNDDSEEEFYPAGYDSVISVSAVNSDKEKASYSNYGEWIEIAAPGGDTQDRILSTLPDGDYGEKMGTSMAAPFVAGAAALRMSEESEEDNEEVREHLQNTAIELKNEGFFGHGLINSYRAAGGEVPTPVREIDTTTSHSSIELTWEEPWHYGASPIEGFRIYKGEYGEDMEIVDELSPDSYNYEDAEVESGITYEYQVAPYNEYGESFGKDGIYVTPREIPTQPSLPKEVEAELFEDHIELNWQAPVDDGSEAIQNHNIYRKESTEENFQYLAEVPSEQTTYKDDSISIGEEYIYGITSENRIGESEMSETEPIVIPTDHVSSPSEVEVKYEEEGVKVEWSSIQDDHDIKNYNIYRKTSVAEEEFEFLVEIEPDSTEYLDKNVRLETEYTYAVTAEARIGESEKTISETVTIPEDHEFVPAEPSSPRNVSAELDEEKIRVTWSEPLENGTSDISSYLIYRETEGGLEPIGEVGSDTFEFEDEEITPSSEYTYGVSAVNEEGESKSSNTSEIRVPENYFDEETESGGFLSELINKWLFGGDDLVVHYIIILAGIIFFVSSVFFLWYKNQRNL